MSVFISYNHKDGAFVDKLCRSLVEQNVKIWRDKWQISVGDSLINTIEAGMEGATYMCIVFSQNSVKSEWVKREINAALLREIDEKHKIILPIIIDDCEIPLLLRDKFYADFRDSFSTGLNSLLKVISRKYNVHNSGRLSDGLDYYIDYVVAEGTKNDKYYMSVDIVSFDVEEDFSILTKIEVTGNDYANKRHLKLTEDEYIKNYLLKICADILKGNKGRLSLVGNNDIKDELSIYDSERKAEFLFRFRVIRLGRISNDVILYDLGAVLSQICIDNGIA